MGFSLGKFFRKAGGAIGRVAPIVSIFNPAAGAGLSTISTRTSEFFAPSSRAVTPSFVPRAVVDGGGVESVGAPGAAVGALMLTGARQIAAILARIAVKIGRRVSLRSVADFIRRFGPSAVVGTVLGITAEEAIQLLMADHVRRFKRHRRGISAADMRRTGATLSKLGTFNRRVHAFISRAGLRPRGARIPRHGHRIVSTRK